MSCCKNLLLYRRLFKTTMTGYVSIKSPSCEETMPLDERERSRKKKGENDIDVREFYGRVGVTLELDLVALLGNART